MINEYAHSVLEKYYGYKSFRKGQEDIINSITGGNDVLAIMPTGGGKSICYQVPALMLEGMTIVISPLISLMKDQVDTLKDMGIEAEFINSTLNAGEEDEVINKIERNMERDIKSKQELEKSGWRVIILWECELKNFEVKMAQLEYDIRNC